MRTGWRNSGKYCGAASFRSRVTAVEDSPGRRPIELAQQALRGLEIQGLEAFLEPGVCVGQNCLSLDRAGLLDEQSGKAGG